MVAAAKAFAFEPGDATAASRCRSRSRSRTRSCRRRRRRRRPPTTEGPATTSVLRGKLVELGTRAPVTSATVTAVVDGRTTRPRPTRRALRLAAARRAPRRSRSTAPAHNPFVQQETLAAKQELAVTYLVERDRYDPYEIVVVGEQRREEVSRITLRGAEIKQVPGTFGDPFRVIQALPGVASVVSLLPFPIVRGASPSSTGFLLDGTRVPLLYPPAVGAERHPSRVHRRDPVLSRRRAGHRTAATPAASSTAAPRARDRDEHLIDVDANLLQVGGLVREPITQLGATVTAAARYGYPGLPARRSRPTRSSLSYWDYQLRARRRHAAQRLDGVRVRRAATSSTPSPPTADPERSEPAARAVADPRLSPRSICATTARSASSTTTARVVVGYDRTLVDGHRLHGAGRRARAARCAGSRQARSRSTAGVEGDRARRSTRARTRCRRRTRSRRSRRSSIEFTDRLGATSRRCGGRRRDWLIRPGVRADVYRRRHRRRSPTSIRASPCATSSRDRDLARRAARQRRQRDLAQGQRRHLSPAAALRAAAARPRHDAAQVRPPALVPDQPRRRGPARRSGSSSRPRATSTTWIRRSSICRSTTRRSSPARTRR